VAAHITCMQRQGCARAVSCGVGACSCTGLRMQQRGRPSSICRCLARTLPHSCQLTRCSSCRHNVSQATRARLCARTTPRRHCSSTRTGRRASRRRQQRRGCRFVWCGRRAVLLARPWLVLLHRPGAFAQPVHPDCVRIHGGGSPCATWSLNDRNRTANSRLASDGACSYCCWCCCCCSSCCSAAVGQAGS
jgi:hypothetical protein